MQSDGVIERIAGIRNSRSRTPESSDESIGITSRCTYTFRHNRTTDAAMSSMWSIGQARRCSPLKRERPVPDQAARTAPPGRDGERSRGARRCRHDRGPRPAQDLRRGRRRARGARPDRAARRGRVARRQRRRQDDADPPAARAGQADAGAAPACSGSTPAPRGSNVRERVGYMPESDCLPPAPPPPISSATWPR